jgi:uncharacterized membrane protein
MQKSNEELMRSAREALRGKWQVAVLVTLVYIIICGVIGSIPRIGPLGNLIIGGPLSLGYTLVILKIKRGGEPNVSQLFDGFSRFVDALVAQLLMTVFVVLWSLLLIVPGIIAALSYAMTFFLLADDPSLEGAKAITKSKQMMEGHKAQLFMLGLRFFGWFLVGVLTLGIGFLWVTPYFGVSFAEFYEGIRVQTPASLPTGSQSPQAPNQASGP